MRTIKDASNGKLEYGSEFADGSRQVFAQIDGVYRSLGTLSGGASQATLEASPGIQSWSNPRGKVSTHMFDPDAVAKFSRQWSRNWAETYPLDRKASVVNLDGTAEQLSAVLADIAVDALKS